MDTNGRKLRSGYFLELNAEDKAIASSELGEVPELVASQIESLRQDIISQPHFTSPTDSTFLLMFLRHANFSNTKALQNIESFTKHRVTSPNKEMFVNTSQMDPLVIRCHRLGICLALPTLPSSGIRTFIFRSGVFNPEDMGLRDAFRAAQVGVEIMLHDEVSQVRGIQYIIDDAGARLRYYTQFLSPTTVQIVTSTFLDDIPCSMRGLHFYRSPRLAQALTTVMKRIVRSKVGSRIYIHSSEQSLHNAVDKSILPTELGGTAGSYEDLVKQSYAEFLKNVSFFDKYSSLRYDAKMKPSSGTK